MNCRLTTPRATRRALGALTAATLMLLTGSSAVLARPAADGRAASRSHSHHHARRHRRRHHPKRHHAPRHRRPVPTHSAGAGRLTFDGSFSTGLAPWTAGGGGPLCANNGTPSAPPRLRGTFTFDTSVVGVGTASGRFTLPADPDPASYPLEACAISPAGRSMVLGTDAYYGIMVYVPAGWTIANHAFFGVEFMEYHFQNVYGAPISFQLHQDHVTLALQTGACNNHATAQPGCAYHSNADDPNGDPGNLPGYYVVPPGSFRRGTWNELVMHVHWASDRTGQIQTWYRVKGASTWTASASVRGIPTVQWDVTRGCCYGSWADDAEAYTAALSAPLSLWLDNQVSGTTFAAVAATMP